MIVFNIVGYFGRNKQNSFPALIQWIYNKIYNLWKILWLRWLSGHPKQQYQYLNNFI